MVSEIIVLGGGASISPHISSLQPVLASKCVVACNYAYKHFPCTFLCFQDRDFYKPRPDDRGVLPNPDCYEELKKLPLIVGINHSGTDESKLNNTILLNHKEEESLTGIFALKMALRLMESGIIYLLGFDWNQRDPKTIPIGKDYSPKSDQDLHYYGKDIIHRGTGYYGFYENHSAEMYFNKLIKKETLKIYNVSPKSNIPCFEKIDYEQFFKLLTDIHYNQDELRAYIRSKLII